VSYVSTCQGESTHQQSDNAGSQCFSTHFGIAKNLCFYSALKNLCFYSALKNLCFYSTLFYRSTEMYTTKIIGNHKGHQTLTPLLGSVMQAYIPTVS